MEWDPAKDATFPKDFVLSEYAAPQWSKDGARLFVGIKQQADVLPENEESKADVDVWHYDDVELQSQQMIQIGRLRRATLASAFDVASRTFVQLADNDMDSVTPTADGRWAIGRDATPYDHDFSEGQPSRADYYRVNTTTGANTLIARHLLRTMGTSPDGNWFLYLEPGT